MEVTLSADSEKIVREKIHSGNFHSPDDVIRAALALLQQQQEDWSAKIEEGWKQALAGQLISPEELQDSMARRKAAWRAARGSE
jgi:putative addiction module CopG family antidote